MYRFMNDEEITIRQMTELKMIHLYQLNGSDAIAVYYDNDKQINLCALDDYYPLLLETVLHIYEQSPHKDSIMMNDDTKNLLNQAILREHHHTSFFRRVGIQYLKQESSLCPRFISDGTIRDTFLPMIQYYLQQLYHMWNMEISFVPGTIGWHRNCVLKASYQNKTLIFPVRLTMRNDHDYKIAVGNFIHDYSTIEFHISYTHDQLLVSFENDKMGLFGESYFYWNQQPPKAYTTISISKKVAYHQDEQIKQLVYTDQNLQLAFNHKPYLVDWDTDFSQMMIYQLPWNHFIIYRDKQTQDSPYNRTDYDTIYVNTYHSQLVLRQYSYSLVENKENSLQLKTDGAVMQKIYYGDKHPEIETVFLPVGYYSGWDYRKYLENKYFYQTAEERQS